SVHPVGWAIEPVFASHDRSNFSVICFSGVMYPDEQTQKLRALADEWHDVNGLSDEELADLIRSERIDVLVDLSLHTARNRLLAFARKPAPVQMTYLAYPSTSGLESMDYRITDCFLDPAGSQEPYTEKSLR